MIGREVLQVRAQRHPPRQASCGFSVIELVVVMLVGAILTAMAVPLWVTSMSNMKLTSTVAATSAAISQTRYRAIMNSQPYTLTISSPADTYVVTNVSTGVSDNAIPLTPHAVVLNGGSNVTYLFCPNGTVWGAGASCPGTGTPPLLTAAYAGRQMNLSVSGVGNVTSVHIK